MLDRSIVFLVALLCAVTLVQFGYAHGRDRLEVTVHLKPDDSYSLEFASDFTAELPTERAKELADTPDQLLKEAEAELDKTVPAMAEALKHQVHVYFDDVEVADPVALLPYEGSSKSAHDGPQENPNGKTSVTVMKTVRLAGKIPANATTFACFIDSGLPVALQISDPSHDAPFVQAVDVNARSTPHIFRARKRMKSGLVAAIGIAMIVGIGAAIATMRQRARLAKAKLS